MNRSRPAVRQAIKFLHERRHRQGLHGARPVLQAAAVDRQVPGRADGARREVRADVTSKNYEPTYDATYLAKVDYDLWLGPGREASVQPQPLPLQLALALGLRQRRHRQPGTAPVRHRALGAEQAGASGANQLDGRLLRSGVLAGNAERRRRRCTSTPTARSSSSARAETTRTTRARSESATCSTAPRAGCGSTATARAGSRTWDQLVKRTKRVKGRQSGTGGGDPLVITSIEFPHYQNFIDAIRANDPKILTCDVLEGHLSSALPHLANISYRVKRAARVRQQGREVQGRQGSGRAADARVPQGLRDSEVLHLGKKLSVYRSRRAGLC